MGKNVDKLWDWYQKMLGAYDSAVALCERFVRTGRTMPHTSSNGYMFSLLNKKWELGIRFKKEVQQKYTEVWRTGLFHSYGAVKRGYVLVPNEIVESAEDLVGFLNESFDYVHTLAPK